MPSTIPKCKAVIMCLLEKNMLDKVHSNKSYSTVGSEFDVNELTVIFSKVPLTRNMHKIKLYINLLMKM